MNGRSDDHLWHLDFVHRHIHQASTFTLILIDDCARFVTGHGVNDAERAEMVILDFEEAVARHGKPERVMHDRGSAFWSWRGISRFTSLLTELGIPQWMRPPLALTSRRSRTSALKRVGDGICSTATSYRLGRSFTR
jgi:transposase InsO family protein